MGGGDTRQTSDVRRARKKKEAWGAIRGVARVGATSFSFATSFAPCVHRSRHRSGIFFRVWARSLETAGISANAARGAKLVAKLKLSLIHI